MSKKQGFALSDKGMHTVDTDPRSHAGTGITGKVKIGHRIRDEGILKVDNIHEGT